MDKLALEEIIKAAIEKTTKNIQKANSLLTLDEFPDQRMKLKKEIIMLSKVIDLLAKALDILGY